MTRRSYLSSFVAFCLIAIMAGIGSLACGGGGNTPTVNGTVTPSPTPNLCGSMSEKLITDAIYGQIALDLALRPQIGQINITYKASVVTLYGWVSTPALKNKVVALAKNTTCVSNVVSTNFYDTPDNPTRPGPAGCVDPYKACGDICIPSDDRCNLGIEPGPVPVGNANTTGRPPTNTGSNTNSTSNSNASNKK